MTGERWAYCYEFNTLEELQRVLPKVLIASQKFTDIEWTFLPTGLNNPLGATGYIGFTGVKAQD